MKGMLRITWLLLLCFGQVNAATTEEQDATAAKALLEKALAHYQRQGDKAYGQEDHGQHDFLEHAYDRARY